MASYHEKLSSSKESMSTFNFDPTIAEFQRGTISAFQFNPTESPFQPTVTTALQLDPTAEPFLPRTKVLRPITEHQNDNCEASDGREVLKRLETSVRLSTAESTTNTSMLLNSAVALSAVRKNLEIRLPPSMPRTACLIKSLYFIKGGAAGLSSIDEGSFASPMMTQIEVEKDKCFGHDDYQHKLPLQPQCLSGLAVTVCKRKVNGNGCSKRMVLHSSRSDVSTIFGMSRFSSAQKNRKLTRLPHMRKINVLQLVYQALELPSPRNVRVSASRSLLSLTFIGMPSIKDVLRFGPYTGQNHTSSGSSGVKIAPDTSPESACAVTRLYSTRDLP